MAEPGEEAAGAIPGLDRLQRSLSAYPLSPISACLLFKQPLMAATGRNELRRSFHRGISPLTSSRRVYGGRLRILELLLMRCAFQMSSSSHQMCQMWKACGEAYSAGTRITQPRTKWLKDTVIPNRERTWRIEQLICWSLIHYYCLKLHVQPMRCTRGWV